MARRARKAKPVVDNRIQPTPEQAARNEYMSAGMAYRKISVIETMLTRGQITDKQFVALDYYRQQASLAERSPVKSCIDFSVKGGDARPSAALASAMIETGRIERDLGSLWQLTRAVAVDDISLTEWCIAKHGGRERYNAAGKCIAIVPVREKGVIADALFDLKYAAGMIIK